MKNSLFATACAASLIFALPVAAEVLTRSAMFQGDLCATDADGAGDYDDCGTIAGNAGVFGVFDFTVGGLDPDPRGDVTIRLISSDADLYAGPGENNPDERFRLLIEGVNFGLLFDSSEGDEAQVNATLAASVQRSISAATGSAAPLDLSLTLPRATIAPFLQDGELVVRLDFREDRNINRFSDPTVSVSYEVEGPSPDLSALAAEIARLRAVIEAQSAAIASLTEAVDALQAR